MRLGVRDVVATVLVALIAIPYVGYLINGEMPFIKDPRGMAAIGLVLGVAAFLVMRWGEKFDGVGVAETVLAVLVLAFGVVTLFLAETAAAEVLLAVFMGSILLMLLVELADHAGVFRGAMAHR